jgi:hypothetical protein
VKLRDLLLDALEDICDVLGLGDSFLDGIEDDALGEGPADERLVLARAFRGGKAAVVAATLALTCAIVQPAEGSARRRSPALSPRNPESAGLTSTKSGIIGR